MAKNEFSVIFRVLASEDQHTTTKTTSTDTIATTTIVYF